MDVALIEVGGSHQECLYPQRAFLQAAGHRVHLISSADTAARLWAPEAFDTHLILPAGTGGWHNWRQALRIREYLRGQRIPLAVFNTASGKAVRAMTLLRHPHTRFAGILHNLRTLRISTSQRIISRRVRRYLVLADYLLTALPPRHRSRLRAFYPIVFPAPAEAPAKGVGELWIAIPGYPDPSRRDYQGLLSALATTEPLPGIKFLVLGPGDAPGVDALRRLVLGSPWAGAFQLWDRFLPMPEYCAILSRADALLPLIHPEQPHQRSYLAERTSGTFSLSFGLRVPMLLHRAFAAHQHLSESAVLYTLPELPRLLATLRADPAPLEAARARIGTLPAADPELQQRRYLAGLDLGPAEPAALRTVLATSTRPTFRSAQSEQSPSG